MLVLNYLSHVDFNLDGQVSELMIEDSGRLKGVGLFIFFVHLEASLYILRYLIHLIDEGVTVGWDTSAFFSCSIKCNPVQNIRGKMLYIRDKTF